MTAHTDPDEFARNWMKAWNEHDVEAVLAHFEDDAVFASPIARRLGHGVEGIVRGKAAIRDYWNAALALNPTLRFTTGTVYGGIDVIVINFTTQDEVQRSEVLIFENGLVKFGYGTISVGCA